MPRLLEAKKDVLSCDKLRGTAKKVLYPKISEWGNLPDLSGVINANPLN
jgi:hypothetical protein